MCEAQQGNSQETILTLPITQSGGSHYPYKEMGLTGEPTSLNKTVTYHQVRWSWSS